MKSQVTFRPYSRDDKESCLGLFDANCPEFFAPNERADYQRFLEMGSRGYELCLINDEVAGAFGLMGDADTRRRLNWIMLNPRFRGLGAGRAIIARCVSCLLRTRTVCRYCSQSKV